MAPESRRKRRRWPRGGSRWPAAIAALAALAVLGVWLGPDLWDRFRAGAPDEMAERPPPAEEAPVDRPEPFRPPPVATRGDPDEAAAAAPALPPLAESDPLVRERVAPLAPETALPDWLDRPDLVDLFVLSIDNVADGASPRKHLPFMKPAGRFLVLGEDDGLEVDPASYRRYATIIGVVDALDAATCASVYRALYPLFQESYAELGYPDRQFHDRFAEALRELLRTPVPPRRPALEPRVKRYVYADPDLESLSDAQKQLLRMGPEGVRAVQAKLREVAAELGIETG